MWMLHTKHGGRKQAPVCGVMLFLPGFKSVHWNKVETVTINYLYEWVQSILEDYNLCRADAVMVQFKALKIRILGANQTSFKSGNFPVQDTKFICTGSIPAQGPWALNSYWNYQVSKMLWQYLTQMNQCPLGKSQQRHVASDFSCLNLN